jgi:HD-GYP domain-containing protein (c-di-GMP phosphodiesterase class II)
LQEPGPGPEAERAIELAYAQATSYADELRKLYAEQRDTRAELDRKVEELEQAQAQLREYARDIAETYRRLQKTYLETLDSLALAVEQRDNMTGGHSHRVAHYAGVLGEAIGLASEARRALSYGSALHDIGKIGIPDAILNKPGRLTEQEWQIMRRHPEIGARMVERVEFLQPAIPIILTHHERFDGGGYPRGLRGEQIPLGSRLFQVADTLDAIVSDRPYRRGQSLEAALVEIRKHSGSQFDPRVVDLLEQVAPRLEILPANYGLRGLTLQDDAPSI